MGFVPSGHFPPGPCGKRHAFLVCSIISFFNAIPSTPVSFESWLRRASFWLIYPLTFPLGLIDVNKPNPNRAPEDDIIELIIIMMSSRTMVEPLFWLLFILFKGYIFLTYKDVVLVVLSLIY